jgi:chemotaxis response regulator CheB
MEVTAAVGGEAFEHGHVYIAPPKAHMLVEPGIIRIEPSATGHRLSSVDALFQSAAKAYGNRVIGVLLSGTMQDGTVGCWAIRQRGGVTIAQDPNEAAYSSMPRTAMQEVPVDYCFQAREIAAKLKDIVAGDLTPPTAEPARIMIVEDEWLLASELERQLTELGYTVVAKESSGEEALAKAAAAKPDIAIMDVGLAGKIKGTDAATELWEQFQIPIIFLTAHADQQTLTAAQSSMPYAFLAKPHHAGQLHSAIQLSLGRRKRESRKPRSARRIS